ncbi:Cytochrome P450 monooxygenase BOA3 [Fusarium oxysporum f. sp. cubense]|uniref:Cytochrome P450 monooxygenase BOA3 n=1 Tax=Fusarium oxysporum f. sp. cubense TaxID=61366 RepID=A0A559LLN3_FUSOC|nr:Cytochrome P450 monooxygenase BOA3 [Fusarium oxysporum f. sp. cubense]
MDLNPISFILASPLRAIGTSIAAHYYGLSWIGGFHPFWLKELHDKYGDIVRIAPNELSFASVTSYREIYSHATKGKKPFLKSTFYYQPEVPPNIFTVLDPREHSRQRRYLAHGFSAQALREQEKVIHHYVNMFLNQLGRLGIPGGKGVDMTEAFHWVSFDIIGDLAFGESFDAVAQARTHPWISLVGDAGKTTVLDDILNRAPLIRLMLPYILPGIYKRAQEHQALTHEKGKKRIEFGLDGGDKDFFAQVLRKGEITGDELVNQAITLLIAGSETTSTALAATTNYLLRNPETLQKLQEEVRGTFRSLEEITGDSTSKLQYLIATIEEGLRIFTPLPTSPPRVSPGATVDGHFIPAGVIVSSATWTTQHDPRYWRDPECFKPERWIEGGFGDNKDASQPFSLGPRGCIGINLAWLEMRIILAKLAFMYDWELAESSKHTRWFEESTFQLLWKKPQLRIIFNPRQPTTEDASA